MITKQTTIKEMRDIPTKELFARLNEERKRVGRDPLKKWSESREKLINTLHAMLQTSLEPTPTRKPKAKTNGTVTRRHRYSDRAIITVLNLRHPKRRTGRDPYSKYRTGMTVAEALETGVKRRDVNYDSAAGHIKVDEPQSS